MQYPFYTVYALAIFTDRAPFQTLQLFNEGTPREARKHAIDQAANLTDVILQNYGAAANLVSWAVIADINLGLDQVYYIYQQGGLNDTGAMELLAKEYRATDPDIMIGWAKEYEYYQQQGQSSGYGVLNDNGTDYKVLPEVIEQLQS